MIPVSAVAGRFTGEHFTLNSISEGRQAHVLTALARLEKFLDPTPIEQATDSQLRAWLVSLLDSGLAPSTVAFYLQAVKPFYRWAWRARLIGADDHLRIAAVAPPRGSTYHAPRPYSHSELAAFWAGLDERWPYASEARLRRFERGTAKFRGDLRRHAMRVQLDAIIQLALVCGLRQIEIYNLSIGDCHWDNKYITVHGKRVDQHPKVRDVPYPDSARSAIERWWRVRTLLNPTHEKMWLSVTGPHPANRMGQRRIESVFGFGDWHLHRLRHTCATERLRAGMPLELLQRFLGHANITQTLAYAQLVRADIHEASERIDAEFQRRVGPPSREAA